MPFGTAFFFSFFVGFIKITSFTSILLLFYFETKELGTVLFFLAKKQLTGNSLRVMFHLHPTTPILISKDYANMSIISITTAAESHLGLQHRI